MCENMSTIDTKSGQLLAVTITIERNVKLIRAQLITQFDLS